MESIYKFFKYNTNFYTEIASTLLILAVSICIALFSSFFIKKQDWNSITKRRYLSFVRNLASISVLVLLFFTWRGEIKAFIISVSALTVGLFVAFKEVILSFFSYFIISSNQLFKIGDIIEVDGKIGKVADRTLLYTKLSLVQLNHSQTLMLPNNLFTTTKFTNLSANGVISKTIILYTSNEVMDEKIQFLKNVVQSRLTNTLAIVEIYLESIDASVSCLKVLVKNLDLALDFNTIKNEVSTSFMKTYPTDLILYTKR